MAVKLEFIRSLPYFAELGQDELDSIRKVIFEKNAVRGEILLIEGEPAEKLCFVVEGAVKVSKTSVEGKEQILQIIRPGESFNDVPVFSGGVTLASAEAMGKIVLNIIKKSDLEIILREHQQVALNVIHVLSQRVHHLVSLVEDLSFRHVTSRVAKILYEYAGDGIGEKPRLTQQEMAGMIGTAREMVGRSIKTLEEEGTIRLDRHRIVITNQGALREMAGLNT
ncbi:Crp/Fnr family transcriptional regulator [Chloroflexota bacterium]